VFRSDRLGLSAALVVAIVYLSVSTPYFASWDNAVNISTAISYTGICAAISTLVLAGGGVDLSVAAVMASAGTTAASLLDAGFPAWVAILAALLVGAVVGLINALLITGVGINPLIATIGTQFAVRGFAYIVIDSRELLISDKTFLYLGQGRIIGLPVASLIMVATFVVVGFAMRMTVFGRHVYAIGGSPDGTMARLSGVPVRRRQYQMYIASGVVSALAGVVLASYSGSATGNAALGLELPVIAAVILGGTALGGGRGTVVGTVLGVILLGIINNGLTLRSVPYVWLFVVQGCALLLAVVIDERRQRSEAR
jgi:ribose/xylose/arabinose/galactoside ABC-type transport system permease subunit